MGKNKKRVIYSTNSEFEFDLEYENNQIITPPNKQQNLKVYIDRHKAGKITVVIKGFIGSSNNIKALSKMLKIKCGVGGTIKNGEIIIQGNIRDKVMSILEKEGYNYKRVGG